MNYIDRNIKKYDRLSLGTISNEDVTMYNNRLNKWKSLKQELSKAINDIKTNERVPLKLYELPNSDEIMNIVNNAPSTLRQLIKDNIKKFNFKNIKTMRIARYHPLFDNIKLNLANDRKQGYKTLFHEMSHKLDHLLNNISQDGVFEELLRADFNRIKEKYMIKYKVSEEITFKNISDILRTDDKMNSISDIIGGITNNKCIGKKGHFKKDYWNIEGNLGREAFAHFGSASIRKDIEELGYIKEVFPKSYKYFQDSLKGVVKK